MSIFGPPCLRDASGFVLPAPPEEEPGGAGRDRSAGSAWPSGAGLRGAALVAAVGGDRGDD